MSYTVRVRPQVREFAETLGMERRRALKRALKDLAKEKGDVRPLHDQLAGYHRLKVGPCRIIFRYLPGRLIECVFAEDRRLVYEVFESEVLRLLGERPARYSGRKR